VKSFQNSVILSLLIPHYLRRVVVDVIIPAYNEEGTIGKVVRDIDRNLVRHVVVVNNTSTDNTVEVAKSAGALVLHQNKRGYGRTCLTGIDHVSALKAPPDVVAFMDGDYSDFPGELKDILAPIREENIDMVIGSRALGQREKGSMTPQQRFGNWLATAMIRVIYRKKYTDLGPFRAIKLSALQQINMQDQTYGWTVEMQVKVIKQGLSYIEIPVDYRRRGAGQSKVAGTLKGTIFAGWKIITTILRYC